MLGTSFRNDKQRRFLTCADAVQQMIIRCNRDYPSLLLRLNKEGEWIQNNGAEINPHLIYKVACQKPSFDWSLFKPEYKWSITDGMGVTYVVDFELDVRSVNWDRVKRKGSVVNGLRCYQPGDCDWMDSLIIRPENT